AEQDARVPIRPALFRNPWTVTWLTLAVAIPLFLWVVVAHARPVNPLLVLAVLAAFVAAESFNIHLEFRRHSVSCSPSELAFVIALVEVGGTWTALARAAAVALVLL